MIRSEHKPGLSVPGLSVLVLGASGELGGAIARFHAARGAHLRLWGRDERKLESVAQACLDAGASSTTSRSVDLQDTDVALTGLQTDDHATPFDIAIIASGLGDIREPGHAFEDADAVRMLGLVNFVTPAAIATELASRMAGRGGGKIVLIGSAAAFHPLPFATAYASSKAGLARFADALRINARPHGVTVTLVAPGFIDTAAARRVPGPKPFMLSPAIAAARIAVATDRGLARVVMPWPFALLRFIERALPRALSDPLLRSLAPPETRR